MRSYPPRSLACLGPSPSDKVRSGAKRADALARVIFEQQGAIGRFRAHQERSESREMVQVGQVPTSCLKPYARRKSLGAFFQIDERSLKCFGEPRDIVRPSRSPLSLLDAAQRMSGRIADRLQRRA